MTPGATLLYKRAFAMRQEGTEEVIGKVLICFDLPLYSLVVLLRCSRSLLKKLPMLSTDFRFEEFDDKAGKERLELGETRRVRHERGADLGDRGQWKGTDDVMDHPSPTDHTSPITPTKRKEAGPSRRGTGFFRMCVAPWCRSALRFYRTRTIRPLRPTPLTVRT